MLKNTLINRMAIRKIAGALKELNEKVVYVGGAVVSLYIDDYSADDVRPTKDIDISLKISSLAELESLRENLIQKGFYQSHEDDVMCRFRFEDIKVDVMSTQPVGWAPGNPWFASGFKHIETLLLDGIEIKILSLPYLLATKFSAFYDRGIIDPRTSHDFEDIVYLLNYTSNMKDLVLKAEKEAQNFLKDAFMKILENELLQEAIIGNLYYENQMKRFERIIDELRKIVHVIQRT